MYNAATLKGMFFEVVKHICFGCVYKVNKMWVRKKIGKNRRTKLKKKKVKKNIELTICEKGAQKKKFYHS